MRKFSLSAMLVAFNVGIVAIAILIVGVGGGALLRRLADDQATTRVRMAAAGAAEAIDRGAERLEMTARLLAERPTLAHLMEAADPVQLTDFLSRFQQSSRLAAIIILGGDRVLLREGTDFPTAGIADESQPQGVRYLVPAAAGEPLMMAAWAPIPTVPPTRAVVVRAIDREYMDDISRRVGLPATVFHTLDVQRGAAAELSEPRRDLRHWALDFAADTTRRIGAEKAYVSIVPLAKTSESAPAAVEVMLSTKSVQTYQARLMRTLLALSLFAVAVGIVLSIMLANRVGRPIDALTEAAARIGRGDLATAVPRASTPEVSTLANAMDDMRERVLSLTTELARKRAEAEAIIGGIAEGVFAVDRERRIRYLNPQAAAMLGIRPDDAFGRFCGDVLRPQGPGGVRPCEESCPILHARFRGSARATEHITVGAEPRAVIITSAPAVADTAEDSEEIHQYQVLRDETELEATRRLRDAVLANISHEFRTPLSAQLASLELLRDRLPELGSQELHELVMSIERGTLRLTRLIDNLLESTRIEAGQDSLRRQRVALDEVIEEAVELMVPLIEQRQQTLEVDLPYPLPAITGDGPRLVQVFVNLLANANKFAPAESTIHIGGEVRRSEIGLYVADEGPGLPDGAGDSLFDRFARGPGEPEANGMGLGLFIVKSIVTRHGGRVESENLERGTRMWVILPREAGDEDPGR